MTTSPKITEVKLIERLRRSADWQRRHDVGASNGYVTADDLDHAANALADREALEQENAELRLAICGGEDAPGHNATIPHAQILATLAENYAGSRAWAEAEKARADRLAEALIKIERWFGEFPDTGKTWPNGSPVSYGASWGSNGERDFMRVVARQALAAFDTSRPDDAEGGDA
ncbi:hypothetical protein [Phenylobacterium immobile]|uniref:hypothetical protein n=1 Tax=Phenylobacterium immobile TaxID=21 RepID=UPI000B2941AC|nr:hypothetical protein [Phenylobacterium immobile]